MSHSWVLDSRPGRWRQRTSTTPIRHSWSQVQLPRGVHWRPPGWWWIVHKYLLVSGCAGGLICIGNFAESWFGFCNSRSQINLNSFHRALAENFDSIFKNISCIRIVDGLVRLLVLLSFRRRRSEVMMECFAPAGCQWRLLRRGVDRGWRLGRLLSMATICSRWCVDCLCDLGLRNPQRVLEPLVVVLDVGVTALCPVARVRVARCRRRMQLGQIQFLVSLFIFFHLLVNKYIDNVLED